MQFHVLKSISRWIFCSFAWRLYCKIKSAYHQKLIDVFNQYKKSTIAIREVSSNKVSNQGIVIWSQIKDNVYKINNYIEKPKLEEAPSNLAIVGRYVLTLDIFDKIYETKSGFNSEIQLTDPLSKLNVIYGIKFEVMFLILKTG